ncbi:MAG: hypothetical protein ACREU8_01690 [Gammaproteobacteria bacterium]
MQRSLRQQRPVYSNRTDLIRTAIRNQLATHAEVVRETVARKTFVLGLQHYTRRDLEAAKPAGQKLQIQVLGLHFPTGDVRWRNQVLDCSNYPICRVLLQRYQNCTTTNRTRS